MTGLKWIVRSVRAQVARGNECSRYSVSKRWTFQNRKCIDTKVLYYIICTFLRIRFVNASTERLKFARNIRWSARCRCGSRIGFWKGWCGVEGRGVDGVGRGRQTWVASRQGCVLPIGRKWVRGKSDVASRDTNVFTFKWKLGRLDWKFSAGKLDYSKIVCTLRKILFYFILLASQLTAHNVRIHLLNNIYHTRHNNL